MPTLGITGGIATGKSTFCRLLLSRMNVDFFDADAYARELLHSNATVRTQVLKTISPLAYSKTGEPDRSLIREIIYNDITKRKLLESILHPKIHAHWTALTRTYRDSNRIFVVDIPLLFETHTEGLLDEIIVVASSEETQIQRMITRRSLSVDIAQKILASQCPLHVKMDNATHVVWNDACIDLLESQVDLLAAYFRQKYD